MNPYYLYNLAEDDTLVDELEKMYISTIDIEHYNTIVYRGENETYHSKINKFENYEEAKKIFDILLLNEIPINKNDPEYKVGEIAQINFCGGSLDWKDYPKIYNWIKRKSFEIFGDELLIRKSETTSNIVMPKCSIDNPLRTLYSTGCILQNHRDHQYNSASTQYDFIKPANILIYLNKNYNKENGGLFIVEDTIEVMPEYGTIVFLNFMNGSDPSHQVSKVVGSDNRFALLFNITYSKKEREIWKIQ